MKNSTRCLVAGALALGTPLIVQAESPHSFSANTALTTNYLFRGISQTDNNPAIQGGFDYAYETGGFADVYAGVWASNLEFQAGASDPASIEIDYYGGLTGEFSNGVSWDVGGLYYHYPGQNEDVSGDYDYIEGYGNLGYTFDAMYEPTVGVGFAYSPDFFGEDGDGIYVNGTLDFALPKGFGLGFLVGYQDVEGDKTTPAGFDYSHYSVSLSKDVSILNLSLSWNDGIDDDDIAPHLIEEQLVFTVSSSF